MNKTIGMVIFVAVMACAAIGGGAWWWVQQQASSGQSQEQMPVLDITQPSYVSLDKIVVMLRTQEPQSSNDYLSLELVFRTDKVHEKAVRAELPMLKGVAVRTLSKLNVETAKAMSIEQWTELLSVDLMAAYADRPALRRFDQIMVSRLIIE